MNFITIKQNNLFVKILYFFFILSLFFPIKHVFLTNEAYLTGEYSDFTSFSLYLSDILLFGLFIFLLISRGKNFSHVISPFKWLILWVILAFLLNFGPNWHLTAYWSLKILELIVAYGTFRLIFEHNELKRSFFKLFTWLCGLESLIGLIQFAKQSPIGLFKFGEQHIGPNMLGIAKIVSDGTKYIRAYGTFPHPNPLSAFLIMGILVTCYLLLNCQTAKTKILYSLLLFLNILGLTITFSRGAYLALAIGLVIYFGFLIFTRSEYHELHPNDSNQSTNTKPRRVAVMLIGYLLLSFWLFRPFLLTRATFSDQSTMARKFYDVVGLKMITKNPMFGLGAGESIINMEKYSGVALQSWNKQPPHNYFIIAAAELGLPAALFLIWFFLWHLKAITYKLKTSWNNFSLTTYYLLLATILCVFLILMQFDHYFYTLQQTQLLLWVLLALIASSAGDTQKENV